MRDCIWIRSKGVTCLTLWTDRELISCFNFFHGILRAVSLEKKKKTKIALLRRRFPSRLVTHDEKTEMRFTTQNELTVWSRPSPLFSLSLSLWLAFSALVKIFCDSHLQWYRDVWSPTSKYDSWTRLCVSPFLSGSLRDSSQEQPSLTRKTKNIQNLIQWPEW